MNLKRKWYQRVSTQTLLFSLGWAFIFALTLPPSLLKFWEYFIFIGAVPITLVWDWFNIQNAYSVTFLGLINLLVLLTPYWYWRKTGETSRWLYASFSLYGLINAALGFTIIISLRGFAH